MKLKSCLVLLGILSSTVLFAAHNGKIIVKVPRFYPSSKTCSRCGNIKEELLLSERTYHCECCGLEIDRDYNASINILKQGLEILKEQEKVS